MYDQLHKYTYAIVCIEKIICIEMLLLTLEISLISAEVVKTRLISIIDLRAELVQSY